MCAAKTISIKHLTAAFPAQDKFVTDKKPLFNFKFIDDPVSKAQYCKECEENTRQEWMLWTFKHPKMEGNKPVRVKLDQNIYCAYMNQIVENAQNFRGYSKNVQLAVTARALIYRHMLNNRPPAFEKDLELDPQSDVKMTNAVNERLDALLMNAKDALGTDTVDELQHFVADEFNPKTNSITKARYNMAA